MEEKYRIRSGSLGHKYAILVTFDNKENLDPIVRVIKKGFEHFETTRQRLQKARELEKREREKIISPGGLL